MNDETYVKLLRRHAISVVERHLYNFSNNLTSIQDLEEKVKAAWYSIPPLYYRKIVNSMLCRVKAYDDVD
ncbi:15112_t:CDS:2, partial [Cetraspora pellucida]